MAQSTFLEFVREHEPPPRRLLDVGCGQGELATALAVEGYDVLGIDARAPQGELFRRVLLEDLSAEDGPFDAIVASHSLHHVRDLGDALDRVVALLAPGGLLLLDELAWDRADEQTLGWLYGQRRALAAAGQGEAPGSEEAFREAWATEHVGVHGYDALRRELDVRFEERAFVWTPFLHRLLHGTAGDVLEQALIDAGAIRPLGFRYAGAARPA